MRLKRHLLKQRMQRMTLRANAQRPVAAVPVAVTPVPRLPVETAPREAAMVRPADCRRRSRRVAVEVEFGVKKLGAFGFQLRALNVSSGGCRVELIEMVDSAERVIVRLPALEPLGADVAWVDGANAGLHFHRALHPAVFEQLIDRFSACAA